MPDLKVLTLDNSGNVILPGDIEMVMDPNGLFVSGPTFLSGSNRSVQDFLKGMLTQLGSNSLARNYGTNMHSLLHSRKLPDISSQLVAEIQYLLGYIGAFNINEDNPAELIEELVSLRATESFDTIDLTATLRVGSDEVVEVSV